MKRIGFLVDSIFSYGGVQRVTAVIAKALSSDYHITIITLESPTKKDTSFYNLGGSNINYRFLKYPSVPLWKDFCCKTYSFLYRKILHQTRFTSNLYNHSSFPSQNRNALVNVLKNDNYDVVIGVHAPLAVRLSMCRTQLPNMKLIGWIHNSYEALFGPDSLYIGPELKKHYEWQLQKLDKTIVLCQYDAKQYSFTPTVIYNPLTLKPGSISDGKSNVFLAVGRFSPLHKGFDLLIEAFHIFSRNNKDWNLIIVGEGQEKKSYLSLIQKYELTNRIFIHSFTNNIQNYYSQASVYVLSSRWEGMPLVLMEAMSHGLPVVSSDLPVCREVLGDFGLYFKNGDVNLLAKRLNDAVQIDWKLKSNQAIEIAGRYRLETIVDKWIEVLEK
jgi:glycosyltransferase involved in cell wall biosynthesis